MCALEGEIFIMRRSMNLMLVVLFCFLMGTSALGQTTTGRLRGQVLDPSGGAVAAAQVTVTNQQTGVTVTVATTSAGIYGLPSVLPGLYKISVEANGFRTLVKKDVPVLADQDNVADAQLELGSASETVEVVAGTVAVQTTSATLNNNFNANDVQLPNASGTLNGSPLNLAVLAPNVVAMPGGVTGVGGAVGGTRPRDNNFTVDGVDDNNLGVTGNNSTVIPDAVAEFALTTNQFSAEYGHSAGGQFSLVTKTGTNNWHGSGEWYNQNRNYNSLDNLTKGAIASGTIPGQPAYDNNRFGGTIGGPLIKNKLFIFGAYEYTTLHGQGTATPLIAPTASGLSTLQSMAADSAVHNILANFPVAPASDLPPITVNGQSVPIGNVVIISPLFQREHDAIVNADYTFGKHQLGARFLFNQENFINPVNSTQAVFNQAEPIHNRKIALSDVWTVNNTVVNDLRLQYSYFSLALVNPCTVCPNDTTIVELGSNTIGPSDNQFQKQNTYQILDTLTWSHGKHTFKFGGQYDHFIYPQFFLPRSNGDYWYNTTQDLVNDNLASVAGRTLRGAGTGSFLGTQSAFFVFAQDDLKLTRKLTLNLGLRYEYWTNPVGGNTQVLNAISNVPGVITFGKPTTDKNNIAPRIGLAFDPTGSGKTAIRAGFGIAYDVKFQNFASITLPPQLQSELNPQSACTLTPQPSWCTTPNGAGFLAGGGLPPTYIAPTTQAAARSLTTSFIDNTVMPKILTWSLSVQHEIYRNASIEVRYLGTRGLELPVQYRRNFISAFDGGITPLPTFFQASDVPASWTASTPTDTPFNNFNPNIYSNFACTTGPGICPFKGNVTSDPPLGGSKYNAASVSFTQRSRFGLTFNANYTWAHTTDNSTNEFFTSLLNPRRAQDTNRLANDWGNSDLNVAQHFALSWTYQVPNFENWNGFVRAVTNGFQISSVLLFQTGQPVTLQSGLDSNGNGDSAGDRASLNPFGTTRTGSDVYAVCELPGGAVGLSNGGPSTNGGPSLFTTPTGVSAGGACFNPADPTGNTFFPAIGYTPVNPKAKYIVTGPGAQANLGRNSWTTPGFTVLNISVAKKINFAESKYLQLKADVFNILNHPNYALSNGNVFSTAGITTATTTPGYALPTDPNFLNPHLFSGGIRSITLGLKLVF
jgi:outer membrane receptor protein involved in Fe transport